MCKVLTEAGRDVAPLSVTLAVHYPAAKHHVPVVTCVGRGGTTGRSSGGVEPTVNLGRRTA